MKKIAIMTSSFGEHENSPIELCRKKGFEIVFNPFGRTIKPSEIVMLAGDAVGLIAGTELITADVLSKLPALKVISRCGAGLDNVDIAAAKKKGIAVFNTPDAPTLAVAELTVGLILALLRKMTQMDRALKDGKWEKLMGNLLYGKRVGIIGFGRIGKKVAELLKCFGCEIAFCDPCIENGSSGVRRLSLTEILGWADIISLHASTRDRILGKEELKLMRKGSWLVNVSRGQVLDEKSLYEAIREKHLAGAALDVFEDEPYHGRLKGLPNVILTPHIGSYAMESRIRMEREAVENLLNGLKEG